MYLYFIASLVRTFLDGIHFRHAIGVRCDEHGLGPEGPYPKEVVQGSARVKNLLATISVCDWLGLNPNCFRLLYQSRSGTVPTEKGYPAIISVIKDCRVAQVHLVHKPSTPLPFQFLEGRGSRVIYPKPSMVVSGCRRASQSVWQPPTVNKPQTMISPASVATRLGLHPAPGPSIAAKRGKP